MIYPRLSRFLGGGLPLSRFPAAPSALLISPRLTAPLLIPPLGLVTILNYRDPAGFTSGRGSRDFPTAACSSPYFPRRLTALGLPAATSGSRFTRGPRGSNCDPRVSPRLTAPLSIPPLGLVTILNYRDPAGFTAAPLDFHFHFTHLQPQIRSTATLFTGYPMLKSQRYRP